MDDFKMVDNDGNLFTLDEPEIKIFATSREKDDEVVDCDPLSMELTPCERADLHQPVVQPINVTNASRSKSLLLLKTYSTRFRGGKVGEVVVNQNAVVPQSADSVPKSTLPVPAVTPVTEPAAQASTRNQLTGQQPRIQKQPTNPRRVTSVLLPPPPPSKTPSRCGRKPGQGYFQNLTIGPPHDEAQGSTCQCISCMRIYFEKLYKISPERCARERATYARRLHRANETPEQLERRRAADREQKRKRMETLASEKREILLAKRREAQRKRCKKLREENRELLLAQWREQKRKHTKGLSDEKREILLAKNREHQRRASKALRAQTCEILLAREAGLEGKSSPRRKQDLIEEVQDDPDPHEIDKNEDEVREDVEEDEYEDSDEPERQSSSDPQRKRGAKRTIETLKLEAEKRSAQRKLRRLAQTPEQREQRKGVIRKAQIKTREKRKLAKEKLGFFVPQPKLTIEQKIEQIAALEEAMKREEEEEKKFMNSYKYDDADNGQDPNGHDSCTVCLVLVRKEDMGFHMKYHAEQDKKKSRQTKQGQGEKV